MLSLILSFFAGVANAFMDLSSEGRLKKKMNKSESWKKKWKTPLTPGKTHWYHFGNITKYEEKFPYSSTFLVSLTDFWHLMKSIMLNVIFLSVVLYSPIIKIELILLEIIINFLLMRFSFGLGFEPIYKYMKTK